MTTELELKHTTALARVLSLIASGEANSIKAACELAGVPRSTYYALRKEGKFDEVLSALEQDTIAEVIIKFHDAAPQVMDKLAKGAINEDGKLSARDSDQNARTLLLYYDKLAGDVLQPATGEAAESWLKRNIFQPIQIVGSSVTIQSAESPEIIEGEAKGLEER